ncbi:hypothetical protein [Bacillus sp. V59.32b]|uniref:hypothetical protein n=1 Tax=Bacillus sp. V59.32b TaxID=1758642 RepID=UPI001058B8F6|nr:hypothetical protein [Bacillus sp. V59.32b]
MMFPMIQAFAATMVMMARACILATPIKSRLFPVRVTTGVMVFMTARTCIINPSIKSMMMGRGTNIVMAAAKSG